MRDFAKSMFSFSWAMSLFGLQQTLNLVKPPQAAKAFDSVREATTAQLGDLLSETFKAGDKVQRELVDLTLGPLTGRAFDPNVDSERVHQPTEGAQQSFGVTGVQSTGSVNQSTPVTSYDSHRASPGWGPMPSS